jgi:hypothetical protein
MRIVPPPPADEAPTVVIHPGLADGDELLGDDDRRGWTRRREDLVLVEKDITRDGKPFKWRYWVSPDKAATLEKQGKVRRVTEPKAPAPAPPPAKHKALPAAMFRGTAPADKDTIRDGKFGDESPETPGNREVQRVASEAAAQMATTCDQVFQEEMGRAAPSEVSGVTGFQNSGSLDWIGASDNAQYNIKSHTIEMGSDCGDGLRAAIESGVVDSRIREHGTHALAHEIGHASGNPDWDFASEMHHYNFSDRPNLIMEEASNEAVARNYSREFGAKVLGVRYAPELQRETFMTPAHVEPAALEPTSERPLPAQLFEQNGPLSYASRVTALATVSALGRRMFERGLTPREMQDEFVRDAMVLRRLPGNERYEYLGHRMLAENPGYKRAPDDARKGAVNAMATVVREYMQHRQTPRVLVKQRERILRDNKWL